jgi:hypothetical protein
MGKHRVSCTKTTAIVAFIIGAYRANRVGRNGRPHNLYLLGWDSFFQQTACHGRRPATGRIGCDDRLPRGNKTGKPVSVMGFERAHQPLRDRHNDRPHHRQGPGRPGGRLAICGLAIFELVIIAAPAHAATPASFTATADQPLSFGTMVTASGGSRTVGADGSTSSNGVFPLGDQTSGPAQFTMTFARASGDHFVYQLIFQFSLPAPPGESVSGVRGTLSGFTTDLPGVPVLLPGQTALYTMPNCVSATCSVTFHVGSTLNVTRSSGGGSLVFPLMVLTTVTAVLG